MRETEYRASRLCRVLGNPIAYQILKALGHNKKRPLELARSLGRGPSTISTHLRALKLIDLVRYETKAGKRGVGVGVRPCFLLIKASLWKNRDSGAVEEPFDKPSSTSGLGSGQEGSRIRVKKLV